MNRALQRIFLYGGAAAAAIVLILLGRRPVPLDADACELAVMTAIREKRFDDARRTLEDMEHRFPTDARGPLLAGFVSEVVRDDLEIIVGHYRRALPLCDSDERRCVVAVCLADLRRRQGRVDEAERDLAEADARYGPSLRSREVALLLALDRSDESAARAALNGLAEHFPSYVRLPALRKRVVSQFDAVGAPRVDSYAPTGEPRVH